LTAPVPIARAREVDLLGRTGADLAPEPDGTLIVALRPWEIRSLRIELERDNERGAIAGPVVR
jgi:hypothetical protein